MDNNNNYLDLVLSMFNQYLYQDCKNNIKDLTLYFRTNPATSGSPIIEELLKAINDYPLESIGLPLFKSILAKTGKTPLESKEIINKIIQFKKYTKDEIAPARKYVRDLIATVYIQRANQLYSDSPSEYFEYLKKINFKSSSTDYLNTTSFDTIDINTIVADSTSDGKLTSSYDFINESFSEGAFKPGDIVVISMPPSVGKSLLAEAEALHMAIVHKVPSCLLIMGDLDMESLFIRLAAIYTGLSFFEVRNRLPEIYKDMKDAIGDNLDIIISPAGSIRADEFVQYIIDSPKKYKAVFADYDENFKIDGGGDSMYTEFGELYNEFTKLKYAGINSWILCQPKQATWSDGQPIELQNLGTSSRKGHIADVCITRSKEPGNLNGLGIFYICKNRHGENNYAYSIRLNNGRFKIIPKGVYQDLKEIKEKRYFNEAEIDMMIDNYNKANRMVRNQISSAAKKIDSPF